MGRDARVTSAERFGCKKLGTSPEHELGRLAEYAFDDRLDDALSVVQVERLLATNPARALPSEGDRKNRLFARKNVAARLKGPRKLEEPDFGRAATLCPRGRGSEPGQQGRPHHRAFFGKRVCERNGIGGHPCLSQVIDRQKTVIYGLVEARSHGRVANAIDELEQAGSA